MCTLLYRRFSAIFGGLRWLKKSKLAPRWDRRPCRRSPQINFKAEKYIINNVYIDQVYYVNKSQFYSSVIQRKGLPWLPLPSSEWRGGISPGSPPVHQQNRLPTTILWYLQYSTFYSTYLVPGTYRYRCAKFRVHTQPRTPRPTMMVQLAKHSFWLRAPLDLPFFLILNDLS